MTIVLHQKMHWFAMHLLATCIGRIIFVRSVTLHAHFHLVSVWSTHTLWAVRTAEDARDSRGLMGTAKEATYLVGSAHSRGGKGLQGAHGHRSTLHDLLEQAVVV